MILNIGRQGYPHSFTHSHTRYCTLLSSLLIFLAKTLETRDKIHPTNKTPTRPLRLKASLFFSLFLPSFPSFSTSRTPSPLVPHHEPARTCLGSNKHALQTPHKTAAHINPFFLQLNIPKILAREWENENGKKPSRQRNKKKRGERGKNTTRCMVYGCMYVEK